MIGKLLADGNSVLSEKGIGARIGAETGSVVRLTEEYFKSLMIEIRAIDAVEAKTGFHLFGKTFSTPVMSGALSGLNGICPNALIETAKGVRDANSVMWVGIGDADELEEVIQTGAKTIKIIKPYRDRDRIFSKIEHAEKAGAFALGMDTIFGFGGKIRDSLIRKNLMAPLTLSEIKEFVKATKLPFVLKGVLSEQDAEKALEAGAGAIVVSHHGGSVLDYAVPPLMILPKIAKVIDKRIPIFIDSGITRGTDVFKALALGADGALVGRTLMAGLAAEGAEGVKKMISGLNDELQRAMSLTGSPDLKSIDPSVIWQKN